MLLAASTHLFALRSAQADDRTPSAGSTLWVLSVGVSRYTDDRLDLSFADIDARSVATALAEQGGRRVYDRVATRVLVNEDVRRATILAGIRDFIEQAQADDVAVLFMAGHGVRDLLTGTYYFLPHDATPEDFFTQGLRVEELTDMVRILQRHVRHVVVVLDTCHAGAAEVDTAQMTRADDFAARVRAEGVFLLAATQPGQKSKELRRLGHGVFTYALLNALEGGANAGADGLLSLAELVIYLGSEVARLTGGEQTPYYLIAGSDVVFADVRAPNSVVVFPFRNQDASAPANDWMAAELQESVHFALAEVPVLGVCPLPEDGDGGGGSLRARAQRLGCGQFVTGSFVVDGDDVELRARLVDSGGDGDAASARVRGRRAEFAALKERLVAELLDAIPTVRAYRMMLEAQGIGGEGEEEEVESDTDTDSDPDPDSDSDNSHSHSHSHQSPQVRSPVARFDWWRGWSLVAPAYGQEETAMARTPESATELIRALLDEFEAAHETKSIDRVAALWLRFTDNQREALRRYLDAADDLTLELADVRIEPHSDGATVALTHIARFVDRESGKPVRLEVRQRMRLVRRDGDWKIERIESR